MQIFFNFFYLSRINNTTPNTCSTTTMYNDSVLKFKIASIHFITLVFNWFIFPFNKDKYNIPINLIIYWDIFNLFIDF